MNKSSTQSYSALDANRDYFQTVLPFSVILGFLSVLGIFGNIFVLYVYKFKYPPCNFKYFVLVLGTIDLLSCILTIPGEIYTQYTWFTMPSVGLCKAKSFFNVATVTCSSVVLLLISVDRFRKVCDPHGWQIKPAYAIRLSITLCIVPFVWSTPAFIFCGPQRFEMDYKTENINVTICLKDDLYKHTIWPSVMMKGVYIGPNVAIMVTTVVLYGLIARTIFKKTGQDKSSQNASTLDRRMNDTKATVNTTENSENWIEPSVLDSDFPTLLHSIRAEQGTSKELTISRDGTIELSIKSDGPSTTPGGTISRNINQDSPSFLLQVPAPSYRGVVKSSPRTSRANGKRYSKVIRRRSYARVRRKTLIMFILTAFFVISTSVYFFLASQMSDKGVFFQDLSMTQEIVVMFFFRFYYFNSLVNAIVYGVLDPRFRRSIRTASHRMSRSMTSITSLMRR